MKMKTIPVPRLQAVEGREEVHKTIARRICAADLRLWAVDGDLPGEARLLRVGGTARSGQTWELCLRVKRTLEVECEQHARIAGAAWAIVSGGIQLPESEPVPVLPV